MIGASVSDHYEYYQMSYSSPAAADHRSPLINIQVSTLLPRLNLRHQRSHIDSNVCDGGLDEVCGEAG